METPRDVAIARRYTFSEDVSALLAGVYPKGDVGINALIFDDASGQYADGEIFTIDEVAEISIDQGFRMAITANGERYVLCSIYYTEDSTRDGVNVTELITIRP